MVKSPWKLLTGLLSRGKTTDQHDDDQASLSEIPNGIEGPEANSTAAEASIETEPAPEPKPSAASQAGRVEAGDRKEPLPSVAAEVPDTMPAGEAPALARDRTVVAIGGERRNRQDKALPAPRRKVKADAPVHTRDAERAIALTAQAAANEPDAGLVLDSEIRELRSQLAVKLRLQNDQLKQMLSRFEPK